MENGSGKHPVIARAGSIAVLVGLTDGRRYCSEKRVGEWKETLMSIARETMMDFFLFVCEISKIESWGTSLLYIRQFQSLYTTVTGRFMDRNDMKELYKVIPELA